MNTPKPPWVVYSRAIRGTAEPMNAVCSQAEWEAMERDQPGQQTLIRAGIGSEGEAERLARGTSGDSPLRVSRERPLADLLRARAAGIEFLAGRVSEPVK